MGAKIKIKHNQKGWFEIFGSAGMQAEVDKAGQRIADEAGSDYEYIQYDQATRGGWAAGGFVSAVGIEGDMMEAVEKKLTMAVRK